LTTDKKLTNPRPEPHRAERGHDFWPPATVLDAIPALYLHYFVRGCDWWVIEFDPDEGRAFGYARLNGDNQCAEWGYVDLVELAAIYLPPRRVDGGLRVPVLVERDLHWRQLLVRDALPPRAWH
jgi:hypothetical protein